MRQSKNVSFVSGRQCVCVFVQERMKPLTTVDFRRVQSKATQHHFTAYRYGVEYTSACGLQRHETFQSTCILTYYIIKERKYSTKYLAMNNFIKSYAKATPERSLTFCSLIPLDESGGLQNRQHGSRHVTWLKLVHADNHELVVLLHHVTQAHRELELTPATVRKASGEQHQDFLAGLDAVGDVVYDVLTRNEVALMYAQPQFQLILKFRHQVGAHPVQVVCIERHEQVELIILWL